jgi:hypothetical protein
MLMIVPLFVIAIMIICDAIFLAIYKFKLCQIAALSAAYAVELPPGSNITEKTTTMAAHLGKASSVPLTKQSIKAILNRIEDTEIVEVEIRADVPLLKHCGFPLKVSLMERAAAPLPANQVRALLGISPYPYCHQVQQSGAPTIYLPIVRPTNSMPVWSFPFDSSLSYLKVVQGEEPNDQLSTQADSHYLQRPSIY